MKTTKVSNRPGVRFALPAVSVGCLLAAALIPLGANAQQRGAAPAAPLPTTRDGRVPVPPADPVVTTTTVVVSPVSVFTIDDAPGADDTTLVGAQSIDIGGPSSLPKGLLVSSDTNLAASVLQANPRKIATFARRFKARVVSAVDTGFAVDQMALWPNDNDPTWLIACNEDGPNGSGAQRINIASGKVEIIIKDGTMTSCDGVRRTPWGTVLLSEEAGGGRQGDGSSN